LKGYLTVRIILTVRTNEDPTRGATTMNASDGCKSDKLIATWTHGALTCKLFECSEVERGDSYHYYELVPIETRTNVRDVVRQHRFRIDGTDDGYHAADRHSLELLESAPEAVQSLFSQLSPA
jgi:hypothetical protein